jgi:hypothetical protein
MELLPALRPIVGELGSRYLNKGTPGGGLQIWQLGQLARGSVDGILDDGLSPAGSGRQLEFLDSAGRKLQQFGQHKLGFGAPHSQRQPNHAAR